MSQSKILVDTNSYLRLAQSIKPLLFVQFGKDNYCLYVIPELNTELERKHLKNKFPWVDDVEFKTDRQRYPSLSKKQKQSIINNFEFIWDYVEAELPGPSRVDAMYIAYAIEMDVHVITDDEDMIQLAKAFDAKHMRTLELLKLMLDAGHIDMTKIRSIVSYWRHIKDTPGQLTKLYRKLFKDSPP
jgi:predicted nucleic acid-binding protein